MILFSPKRILCSLFSAPCRLQTEQPGIRDTPQPALDTYYPDCHHPVWADVLFLYYFWADVVFIISRLYADGQMGRCFLDIISRLYHPVWVDVLFLHYFWLYAAPCLSRCSFFYIISRLYHPVWADVLFCFWYYFWLYAAAISKPGLNREPFSSTMLSK